MAKSIPATHYNPSVLRWARGLLRMSEEVAAEKLKTTIETYAAWESGLSIPSVATLRAASDVFRVPFAAFFMRSVPDAPQHPPDRRLIPGATGEFTYELMKEIREIQLRQAHATELLDSADLGFNTFDLHVGRHDSPESAASRLREALGVGLDDQFSARGEYEPLKLWRTAVENLGVLVFQMSVDPSIARGVALFHERVPAIAVNSQDAPNGRTFTLLHELVHLALRASSLCHTSAPEDGPADPGTEVFCNAVAGRVLVPLAALEEDPTVRGHTGTAAWSGDALKQIARRFGVSEDVVARRIHDSGGMGQDEYTSHLRRLSSRKRAKKKGAPTYYPKVVANHGRAYIGLVFEAYAQNRISTVDVSRFLNVKVGNLDKLRQRLGAQA